MKWLAPVVLLLISISDVGLADLLEYHRNVFEHELDIQMFNCPEHYVFLRACNVYTDELCFCGYTDSWLPLDASDDEDQICPSQPFDETMNFRIHFKEKFMSYTRFEQLLLIMFNENRLDRTAFTSNVSEVAKSVRITSARCSYAVEPHFEVTVALPGNYANLVKPNATYHALKKAGYNMTTLLDNQILPMHSIRLMKKDANPAIAENSKYVPEIKTVEEGDFEWKQPNKEEVHAKKYIFMGLILLGFVIFLVYYKGYRIPVRRRVANQMV